MGFCEADFWRSAFPTRCWFAALSVVMDQCWPSVRLCFGGQHSRRDVGLPQERFRNSHAGKRSETVGERFKNVQEWCGGLGKRLETVR